MLAWEAVQKEPHTTAASGQGHYHTTLLRNRIYKAYQEMRGFSLSYFPAERLNTHLVFTREGEKQAKDFRENKVCFL